MKQNLSAILQALESDDELPDDYNDIPIQPAYRDDHRFDEIKFPWVNNVNLSTNATKSKTCIYDKSQYVVIRRDMVLSGQDLYCLKAVKLFTCDRTFIWFVNFLLYKDLQSRYCYLKSCLVDNDFIHNFPFAISNCRLNEAAMDKNKYEIVIKK